MKNILIILLTITSIGSITYAYQQKQVAREAEMRALEMQRMADEQRMIAEEQMAIAKRNEQLAMANAEEAHRQRIIAEESRKK